MGQSPIRDMFEALVPEYDRFNALSSLGLDASWRLKVARILERDSYVLDVGTGTGDLAKVLAQRGNRVVGTDFSEQMVASAERKLGSYKNVSFRVASADELPFEPRTFDGLTSAFVIRNLHHGGILSASFREFFRVLKPGAQTIHLELTRPHHPVLAWGHKKYLQMVLPMIGRAVFGDRWPKDYLSETIKKFPEPTALCQLMRWAGFEKVHHYPLSGGIAGLFIGTRC